MKRRLTTGSVPATSFGRRAAREEIEGGAKPSGKGSVANRARGEWVGMRGEEPSGEAMNGVRRSGSDDRKEDPTKGGYE